MNEIAQTCCICGKPHDQMLMLSCIHDPCINCAASAYAQQIYIKGHNKDSYVCQICGEETVLDHTTIAQLSALASSVIKMPSKSPASKATPHATAAKRKEVQTNSSIPGSNAKKIVYYCKQHPEEEITYYCFTCRTNICPQCVIHGSHKDHDVKLIRKAITQIKGEFGQLVNKTNDSQGNMGRIKQSFLRMVKDNNDRHTRERNTLTRQFDIIRSNLAVRQKQMLKQLDEINKQNLAALTSFLETINVNYEDANKLKRTVEVINKKDDVLILEEYRKINELQDNLEQIQRSIEGISGHSSHLNVEFLQQECKEIVQLAGRLKINLKRQDVGANPQVKQVRKGPGISSAVSSGVNAR